MTQTELPKRTEPVRSVAIIGGGASGAIALDSLIKEGVFDKITVFERRDVLGGVWHLDENPDQLSVPPGAPESELDPPLEVPVQLLDDADIRSVNAPRSSQQRYIHTASFDGMRTNIPERIMTYSDDPHWEFLDRPGKDTFTSVKAVSRYIETYLARHPEHVVLRTTVEDISKDFNKPNSQYKLVLRTETDQKDENGDLIDKWWTESYDAVILANGHYHVPYITPVPGIDEVFKEFPGVITHAKTFRDHNVYKDKRVIVVGARASAIDIYRLISPITKEVYSSRRSPNLFVADPDGPNNQIKPVIDRYEVYEEDGKKSFRVVFEDGSVVTNPDEVIYGTGFRFSFPFLKRLIPDFSIGNIIPLAYQHTFYIPDPTLALVGVPIDGLSFRVFEYQAVLVARFFAGNAVLPPEEVQRQWTEERFSRFGNTRQYHSIGVDAALPYYDDLITIGGGVDPIGKPGSRPFPVLSVTDIETLKAERERLRKFFNDTSIQK
ncbi:Fmo1p [Sugiyamaella lignohabitans]|uniref:Fmo1p n=1 Tax=Sugiyamaella lignohabitans TaxID=796027 RepID=A0A167E3R1_9ASCO|nr:Fmo1p [Sugiyamaella lignohabitans]ANB13603.1 Fmo1p [Sugiyamaella lignohabitans]